MIMYNLNQDFKIHINQIKMVNNNMDKTNSMNNNLNNNIYNSILNLIYIIF